jgi:TDG/mug DNA glycosylase family protein
VVAAVVAAASALADELPLRLAAIHRSTDVGQVVTVDLSAIAGRQRRADVIHGGGFFDLGPARRRGERRLERLRTLPDYVARELRMICVGLNPSLYAADAGVGFARPGNRFWPAMLAAEIAPTDRDPLVLLTIGRVGMTDLVRRATPRAEDLTVEEYAAGVARVERLSEWLEPRVVCFLGLDGWRRTIDRRATSGWQERTIGGRPAYVMPNPSGLNAHVSVDDLAAHLRVAIGGRA